MGGVDLIDILISLYCINVRSKKYYMKIISHLIDLSLVNAWLLYRRHCSQINVPKKRMMSLLTFRVNAAEALLKSAPPAPPAKRGRPSSKSLSDENNSSTYKELYQILYPQQAFGLINMTIGLYR